VVNQCAREAACKALSPSCADGERPHQSAHPFEKNDILHK
jgi:hypothetical protein